MYDGPPPAAMQRARGRAEVALRAAAGGARLARLHQSGSAKAMLPRVHGPVPEVVFLNTAGGLTGGDELRFALSLDDGARACGTTQTAERAYASAGGAAGMQVALSVGAGGWLDWLPQETILFDRSALARRTRIDLGLGAGCLAVEAVVLGRAAMGETVQACALTDRREIWRAGRPVVIEPLEVSEAVLSRREGAATLAGARALATVTLVADGAEAAAEALRALPLPDGVRGAVSGWDGRCILRLHAADGWPLRRALAAAITHIRRGPLPRVWQI